MSSSFGRMVVLHYVLSATAIRGQHIDAKGLTKDHWSKNRVALEMRGAEAVSSLAGRFTVACKDRDGVVCAPVVLHTRVVMTMVSPTITVHCENGLTAF